MGNSSVKEIVSTNDTVYITKDEKILLKDAYERLGLDSNIDISFQSENLVCLLGLPKESLLVKILANYLVTYIKDYVSFETLIVDCTRGSSKKTIETYWAMLDNFNISGKDQLRHFIILLMELVYSEVVSQSLIAVVSERLTEFLHLHILIDTSGCNTDTAIDFKVVLTELNNYAPNSSKILESYLSNAFFKGSVPNSMRSFRRPALDMKSNIVSECDIFPLALYSETLQGDWKLLYSTAADGLSFNRIMYNILGYHGPTCILIRCQNNPDSDAATVMGAFVTKPWKECNRFYGSSRSFLFSLSPRLRIYRSNSSTGSYQWLNSKSYSLPHGMGFGGTTEGFRLFIPDSLEHCVATSSCPTFETGKLLPTEAEQHFEIDQLEIWGCGDSQAIAEALQAQVIERKNVDENIRKARQVDKAAFFNNEFDKEFFLSKSSNIGGNAARFGSS